MILNLFFMFSNFYQGTFLSLRFTFLKRSAKMDGIPMKGIILVVWPFLGITFLHKIIDNIIMNLFLVKPSNVGSFQTDMICKVFWVLWSCIETFDNRSAEMPAVEKTLFMHKVINIYRSGETHSIDTDITFFSKFFSYSNI